MSSVAVTILSGVSVFVLGQIVQKYVLDPLMEYKKVRASILKHLISSAGTIAFSLPTEEKIAHEHYKVYKDKAVEFGSDLVAVVRSIPLYRFYSIIFKYPSLDETFVVASDLIDISNNFNENRSVDHYFKNERKDSLERISRIMRYKLSVVDLELIATGSYRNGKSIQHVIEGVEKSYLN